MSQASLTSQHVYGRSMETSCHRCGQIACKTGGAIASCIVNSRDWQSVDVICIESPYDELDAGGPLRMQSEACVSVTGDQVIALHILQWVSHLMLQKPHETRSLQAAAERQRIERSS